MSSLIILFSYHHKNTEKVAQVIAKTLDAEIKKPEQTDPNSLTNYDLLGFGSGIYFRHHHKVLLQFVDKIPQAANKKAFIFSTSGQTGNMQKFHKQLKEKLLAKGFNIVSEFNCAAFDTFGLLKIVGGLNKERPNEDDLEKAKEFALSLKKNMPDATK
ncbi:MAG: flavodoxin family protein [Candidatus Bathyarchaeia archaeon]|jgi:flavodoxin